MSDSLLNTFLHYGTAAQRAAFVPDPPVVSGAPVQALYMWRETDTGSVYLYDTSWHLVGGGGTVTHTVGALAANALVVGHGGPDLQTVAALDGQIPIGQTSDGSVAFATLNAGSGITITNAPHSVTIAASASVPPLVIGYVINDGSTNTSAGPYLVAPRSGTFSTCKAIVKAVGAANLLFDLLKNGVSVFGSVQTLVTSSVIGAVQTFSASGSVSASDVFMLSIVSGSAPWQFTVQIET